MPIGPKDERRPTDVIGTPLKVAQIATSKDGGKDVAAINAQVPDPDRRPGPSPPPPRPENPERDDPEQDDPQEPEQKPPPRPPWLNQASTCV